MPYYYIMWLFARSSREAYCILASVGFEKYLNASVKHGYVNALQFRFDSGPLVSKIAGFEIFTSDNLHRTCHCFKLKLSFLFTKTSLHFY